MQEKIYILYLFFLDIQHKVDYLSIEKMSFRHSTLGEESVTMRGCPKSFKISHRGV